MPIQTRPIRSPLALALIVSLVVAGSPGAALGYQSAAGTAGAAQPSAARPSPDAHEAANTAPNVESGGKDRAVYQRSLHSLDRPVVQRATLTNAPAPARVAWVTRATAPVPEPKPKAVSTAEAASGGSGASGGSSANYTGRNHVWIPALGINRSVSAFACTSSAYPGNRVYRWGCAGSNNIYLFGHAYSVFKPLHDAYVRGRLSKGMKVIYADSNGKVSTYAVAWWKTTTPDKGAWAYAGQSRPSLTLQTCIGARSQYRLIVRLYRVG